MVDQNFYQELLRAFPNLQEHIISTFGPQVAEAVQKVNSPPDGTNPAVGRVGQTQRNIISPGPGIVRPPGTEGPSVPTGSTPAPAQVLPNRPIITQGNPGVVQLPIGQTFGQTLAGAVPPSSPSAPSDLAPVAAGPGELHPTPIGKRPGI